jgi:release factor glutamine methyltransferase
MSQTTEIWTVRDVLNWTAQRFSALELPTPLLDAQLLIGSVLSLSKVQIYTQLDRPLIETERSQLRELVRRRLSGEPVAYLLNQKDWHDLDLFVDKRVLVPRPETETLLDLILAVCRHESWQPQRILDLCTGSGCLAIALAKAYPQAKVVAVDATWGHQC